LRCEFHRAEQRADMAPGRQSAFYQPFDPPDFAFAGQEDQNAAVGFGYSTDYQIGQCRFQTRLFVQGAVQMPDSDRKTAPFGGDDRHIPHQGCHWGCVKRGRHRQKQ
jgi:hypothetical protein